ncbi:MAG: fibronectin type III domain-containing protein, partial [Thermoplasmata archaeon]
MNKKVVLAVVIVLLLVIAGVSVVLFYPREAGKKEENEGEGGVVIAENVRQPEYHPNLDKVIVNNDSVVYTYTSDPGTLNYTKGDIIVGTTGFGYLRKVKDVIKEGNKVTVITEQASLSDAIKEGKFNLTTRLTPEMANNTTRATIGADFVVPLEHTIYSNDSCEVKVSGEARFGISITFEIEIHDWKLQYFYFGTEITKSVSLSLTATGKITLSKEYTLFTRSFNPIIIWIGFLPVVIVPVLNVSVGAELNLEAGFTTGIEITSTTTEGVMYEGGQWTPIKEITREITYTPPTLSLSLDAMGYVCVPKLSLLIYGVTGPYGILQPYLRLHASPSETPWWVLYGGFKGIIGVEIKIFDNTLADVRFELLNLEWKLANASVGNPPSAPRNLQAVAGNQSVTLSWQPPDNDGGSAITNYKVYRGTTSGNLAFLKDVGNVLTYTDTGLTNGQTYYYQVSAVNSVGEGPRSNEVSATPSSSGANPPSAPRNLQAVAGNQSVTLSWQPPDNDGG